jgi:hypothetical protein
MRFTKIVWPAILVALIPTGYARIILPKFAAKQSLENIRFITQDGRFTYSQKRSGALSMSTSFKTVDVLMNPPGTNYAVGSSEARKKLTIEIEANWHQDLDLNKVNDIMVGPLGGTQFTKIGRGRIPKLHLEDEWLTWYDPKEKLIHVQMLRTPERHHVIRLGKKNNSYFFPDVVMINPETVLYTDVNDKGISALLAWNMVDKKMTVVRKSEVAGTRLELCRRENMMVLGEFSYDDANKGTTIMVQAWRDTPRLGGFTTVYRVSDNDLGQMICARGNRLWFVKTMSEDRKLNTRRTEATLMELPSGKITVKSDLEHVANLVDMDGRILIPMREDVYVLEGYPGSSNDTLHSPTPARTTP